jgi:hypothetical protein
MYILNKYYYSNIDLFIGDLYVCDSSVFLFSYIGRGLARPDPPSKESQKMYIYKFPRPGQRKDLERSGPSCHNGEWCVIWWTAAIVKPLPHIFLVTCYFGRLILKHPDLRPYFWARDEVLRR